MDDVNGPTALDIIEVIVLSLGIRTQPAEPEQELPRCERLVIYLPDREVWVTSTRSSTASVDKPRVYPHKARDDDDEGRAPELHSHSVADYQAFSEQPTRGHCEWNGRADRHLGS